MKTIHALLFAGTLAFLVAGCATGPANHPRTPPPEAGPQRLEIDGLAISVRPMTDAKEVKRTLKVNLLARGVLPIELQAENRNSTVSFIIVKEKIGILNGPAAETNSLPRAERTKDIVTVSKGKQVGRDVAIGVAVAGCSTVVGALLVLPTILNPPKEAMIDRGLEYKLATKEFYTRTLAPGQKAGGIVFLQYNKSVDPSGTYHLVVGAQNSSTQTLTPFDFVVQLQLKEL